jgi:hypothetical protein
MENRATVISLAAVTPAKNKADCRSLGRAGRRGHIGVRGSLDPFIANIRR